MTEDRHNVTEGTAASAAVLPLPMLRQKPAWVEHVATRIFAKVGTASRPKVRAEIVAVHRRQGVPLAAAEADADATMAYIEARVALYRAAADAPIDPRGAGREAAR